MTETMMVSINLAAYADRITEGIKKQKEDTFDSTNTFKRASTHSKNTEDGPIQSSTIIKNMNSTITDRVSGIERKQTTMIIERAKSSKSFLSKTKKPCMVEKVSPWLDQIAVTADIVCVQEFFPKASKSMKPLCIPQRRSAARAPTYQKRKSSSAERKEKNDQEELSQRGIEARFSEVSMELLDLIGAETLSQNGPNLDEGLSHLMNHFYDFHSSHLAIDQCDKNRDPLEDMCAGFECGLLILSKWPILHKWVYQFGNRRRNDSHQRGVVFVFTNNTIVGNVILSDDSASASLRKRQINKVLRYLNEVHENLKEAGYDVDGVVISGEWNIDMNLKKTFDPDDECGEEPECVELLEHFEELDLEDTYFMEKGDNQDTILYQTTRENLFDLPPCRTNCIFSDQILYGPNMIDYKIKNNLLSSTNSFNMRLEEVLFATKSFPGGSSCLLLRKDVVENALCRSICGDDIICTNIENNSCDEKNLEQRMNLRFAPVASNYS